MTAAACHADRPRSAPICAGDPPPVVAEPGRQVIQAAHPERIKAVSFGPRGLLATCDGSRIKVWQVEQRLLLLTIDPGRDNFGAIAWAGPDRIVAEHGLDGAQPDSARHEALQYDLAGRSLGAMPAGWEVIATPRGGLLRRAEIQGRAVIAQVAGGPERRVEAAAEGARSVSIARDGSAVALAIDREDLDYQHGGAGDARGRVTDLEVWHFDPGGTVHRTFTIRGRADRLELTDDGEHLRYHETHSYFTSEFAHGQTTARTTSLLDTRTGTSKILDGTDGHLTIEKGRTTTSPDGTLVATIDRTGALEVAPIGQRGWRYDPTGSATGYRGRDAIADVYFPPAGRVVIAALEDGSMIALDRETGAVHGRLGAALDVPVRVFPHGDHELVVVHRERIVTWDLATATPTVLGPGFGELGYHRWLAMAGDALLFAADPPYEDDFSNPLGNSHFDTFELSVGDLATLPSRRPGKRRVADIHDWPASSPWPPPADPAGTVWRLPGWIDALDLADGLALVTLDGPPRRCAVIDLRGGGAHPLAGLPGDCHGRNWDPARRDDATHVSWTLVPGHVLAAWTTRIGDDYPPRTDRVEVRMWDLAGRLETSATLPPGKDQWASDVELARSRDGKTLRATRDGAAWSIDVATGAVTRGASPDVPDPRGWTASIGHGGVEIETAIDHPAVTLLGFRDQEYLAFTPDGYYTGTREVGDRVAWVFAHPYEGATFAQYAPLFDRRDVIVDRLRGRHRAGTAAARRPPRIAIEPPVASGGRARVVARASSAGRVDVVRLFVDGRPAGARAMCARDGSAALDVPLHAGTNRITAVAYDDAGLASRWVSADVAGPAAARPPKVWVTAVGVSAYPQLGVDQQLAAADDDARAIAKAFRDQAARGVFSEADVVELIDRDATEARVLGALRRLDQMAPDDLAIVFFAGHGVKPRAAGRGDAGAMVFLTADATPALDHGIAWRDVTAALGRARGRVVVLLDACHAGHFARDVVAASDDLAGAFATDGRAGVLVFSAAKGRQLSYEPTAERALRRRPGAAPLPRVDKSRGNHGLFTAALLHALADPAADLDRDGDLEISEWIGVVTEQVGRDTRGLQTPWVARREIHGDLKIGAAPPPPPPPAPRAR